jgi:hypothetical protein
MPREHHEELFRDLFRVFLIEQAAGSGSAAEMNRICMEVILSAGKISSMRRLEIEIGVTAVLAVTTSLTRIKHAAA